MSGDKHDIMGMTLRDWFAGQALAGLGDRRVYNGLHTEDRRDEWCDTGRGERLRDGRRDAARAGGER